MGGTRFRTKHQLGFASPGLWWPRFILLAVEQGRGERSNRHPSEGAGSWVAGLLVSHIQAADFSLLGAHIKNNSDSKPRFVSGGFHLCLFGPGERRAPTAVCGEVSEAGSRGRAAPAWRWKPLC